MTVTSGVAVELALVLALVLMLAVPVDEPVPLLLLVSELLGLDVIVSLEDGEDESVAVELLLLESVRSEVDVEVPERVCVAVDVTDAVEVPERVSVAVVLAVRVGVTR